MSRWKTAVEATAMHAKLLVTDSEGSEILKAVLPPRPDHPRALLTLLEGLALWSGHPLTAVISVGRTSRPPSDSALFGADLFPCDSALVRYDVVELRRRRTLSGLGDFRQLRLIQRGR
jgi:hypothetical protein